MTMMSRMYYVFYIQIFDLWAIVIIIQSIKYNFNGALYYLLFAEIRVVRILPRAALRFHDTSKREDYYSAQYIS